MATSVEGTMREFLNEYEKKLREGILPPDPARIANEVLEIPAEIEHATLLPPLLERVHNEVGKTVVGKLPRLPKTRDFGVY